MSVISSASTRSHKVHHFHFYQPVDLNTSITRGYVTNLFSQSSSKSVGHVILNGFSNFIDLKEVVQLNFSLFLENGSLSMNTNFHFVRDSIGKITFPNKIIARDQNGRVVLAIITQNETDLNKIQLALQHI
jgi:hypothetical protein